MGELAPGALGKDAEVRPAVPVTGGRAVVDALAVQGVRHVFGIPGDHTIPIYAALGGSPITHCTVRHEQGAGFMADGYGRSSGEPGVAIVIGGPGLTNIATPLAEADADGAPMLVISADTPLSDLGQGRDHNHELRDQLALGHALCGRSERVESVAGIPAAVARAFAGFRSGPSRPAHIGIPTDVLTSTAVVEPAPCVRTQERPPNLRQVEEAAAMLGAAQRPLILLGGGARFATAAAERLATRLAAPVMTTWSGKDAFPNEHQLWTGGGFHLQAATAALADADVVLAVGTRFGRSDFWHEPARVPGTVIRVDLEPSQLDCNVTAAIGLASDARLTMDALAAAIEPRSGADAEAGLARATTVRQAIDAEADEMGALYKPWLQSMRRALPDDTVIAADSTLATYFGFRYLPIPAGGAWLYPNAYGTLGYALPAAIGARIAQPSRPAATLIGDGGLLFTCPELLTAAEQGMGLPVVVWNNQGYGSIRLGMRQAGYPPLGVDFAIPDLAALATGFGAAYARASSPAAVEGAIGAALERAVPTVIEIDASE